MRDERENAKGMGFREKDFVLMKNDGRLVGYAIML